MNSASFQRIQIIVQFGPPKVALTYRIKIQVDAFIFRCENIAFDLFRSRREKMKLPRFIGHGRKRSVSEQAQRHSSFIRRNGKVGKSLGRSSLRARETNECRFDSASFELFTVNSRKCWLILKFETFFYWYALSYSIAFWILMIFLTIAFRNLH